MIVLLLTGCTLSEESKPAGGDPSVSHSDSGSVTDTDDTGTGTDTGDTEDTDRYEAPDTGDRLWPVYDCPGPPSGAVVVELTSYDDVSQYFINSQVSEDPFGWMFTSQGSNSYARSCDLGEVYGEYQAGVDGAYAATINLTLPAAFPEEYLGEHRGFGDVLGEGPGALVALHRALPEPELEVVISTAYDTYDAILCLSRVRPSRVSGTFQFLAHPDAHVPEDFHIVFDFVSEGIDHSVPDWWYAPSYYDGTCMAEVSYDFYTDHTVVWDRNYWYPPEATGSADAEAR